MSFYDYASSRLFEITQKKPTDLKILLTNRIDQARLLQGEEGYRIILPKPKKAKAGTQMLHGIEFPKTQWGSLLQMFTASVYHLGVHIVASDFSIYEKWAKNKDRYLTAFVKSVIEDVAVETYIKEYWPILLPNIAYANTNTYLRLREAGDRYIAPSLSIHQAVLSQQMTGLFKGNVASSIKDAGIIANILTALEESIAERCREKEAKSDNQGRLRPRATEQERLEAALKIWEILQEKVTPLETPARPYGEYWGGISLFDLPLSFEADNQEILKSAYNRLNLEFIEEKFVKAQEEFWRDATRIFEVESAYADRMKHAIKQYSGMETSSNIRSYSVPIEDYSEYLRTRGRLAGSIRRILEEARKVKQVTEEIPQQESGELDLQAAIQVIASGDVRNDIFTRQEILQKSEAWAILIDASLSLKMFEIDVRSVAVCLAEVAKDLVTSPSAWGLFAFNDTYQIVKDFYEPYSNRARAKIGGLKHSGLSYIPDAVDLTAKALAKTSEDVKILLIVTDGKPLGYPGVEERLKESLTKARVSNITPVVIGMGNRDIKRIYTTSCSIDTPYDLMKQFVKTYQEIQTCV
jgi:hypothetical protein